MSARCRVIVLAQRIDSVEQVPDSMRDSSRTAGCPQTLRLGTAATRLRRTKLDQTTIKLTFSRPFAKPKTSVEAWKEAVLIAQFFEVDHEAKFHSLGA